MSQHETPAEPLGRKLRSLRKERGLSLDELANRSGISKASLSKVENDKMSLTYAKLQSLSRGLGVEVAELFFAGEPVRQDPKAGHSQVARRSVDRLASPATLSTHHYAYTYLHTDLLRRQMTPFRMVLRARTMGEFGELIRHPGEEFIVVTDGVVDVHTEVYSPVRLAKGDSLYIDSEMGHAYLSVGPADATIICVCAGDRAGTEPANIATANSDE
jgi:transcriptional regulator with XRE-family HTH domain